MRQEPDGVSGVAVQAKPHLIVDPAPAHGVKAGPDHGKAGRIPGAAVFPQQKEQVMRRRELGCAAKPAVLGVKDGR